METNSVCPIFRIGTRSISDAARTFRPARLAQRRARSASASVALVRDVAELDAERDDRLRDLRPDAGDGALRPEQPGRAHRLEQVLGDLGVHRRHAGDVDASRGRPRSPTSVSSSFSMTSWVRAESSVPTSGTAMMPSHSRTTGRGQLEHAGRPGR